MSKSPGTVPTELSDYADSNDEDRPPSDADALREKREAAVAGGARYRGQTGHHDDDTSGGVDTVCQSCGNHVTPGFVRVFGTDGRVEACPDCEDSSAIFRGAAAGRERRDTL